MNPTTATLMVARDAALTGDEQTRIALLNALIDVEHKGVLVPRRVAYREWLTRVPLWVVDRNLKSWAWEAHWDLDPEERVRRGPPHQICHGWADMGTRATVTIRGNFKPDDRVMVSPDNVYYVVSDIRMDTVGVVLDRLFDGTDRGVVRLFSYLERAYYNKVNAIKSKLAEPSISWLNARHIVEERARSRHRPMESVIG